MTDTLRFDLEQVVDDELKDLFDERSFDYQKVADVLDECEATLSWTQGTRSHVWNLLCAHVNEQGPWL